MKYYIPTDKCLLGAFREGSKPRSYRVGMYRRKPALVSPNRYRTLDYDKKTYDVDSDIRDAIINSNRKIKSHKR